ncbi:hypothetical protein KDJ57_gp50 [Gordonia phage Catfish]|uniref:Uncharacterized protein n=1 Tax=Gordonia phage Catfish TaxID=2301538 RepID=A0A385D0Y8_9CAUD|nr:hypothetical protein KDJ57_gp50 [Gordonia phage Catfish]AXQ51895.1 hypothetical protein SEA_CATFISH_59 [Gordonia phage Catfish]
MKTRTTEVFEVKAGNMSPIEVDSREQLARFLEAARELGDVTVRRSEITVTQTDWEAVNVDEYSPGGD